MIPYGTQSIDQNDIDAVVAALQSDFLTQGPVLPRFESALAERVEARFAVAVNSATSALHLSCLALGLGEGDWLWTSPNTFVASANVGKLCGAKVDFVDIDLDTGLMSMDALEQKLVQANKDSRMPKIVMPVHFAGQSCDMQRLHQLGQQYGFYIIEDASHAIGASYLGRPVGACQFSDVTVFSFHPVKILTTGEGGVATSNQPGLVETMRLLRSHGVTRDRSQMTEPVDETPWGYQQVMLGLNYRMTELQAALGLSQLSKLEDFVQFRRQRVTHYQKKLSCLPVQSIVEHGQGRSAWHLFTLLFDDPGLRTSVFSRLRGKGVGVNVHYIPVHTQPFYRQFGFDWGDFPQAEDWYRRTLTLPLHPKLTFSQQQWVVDCLEEALA
ncbi:UDP-4-amino-4,6-dideoxy-N-acetyl-beta-L-altrosamine transaminase [Hydrogenovibrio halophilus]|uniref:UDP-4-amino-4, 6-dideoxy-N-acetyl-beta-L-altrosamine transaminase n=1 Tax=Hydrogenovibrio halophilus TaxID=373391 RepID=UPI00036205F4|nr:UDP-4-amino-4,6-dideoxy-N-acetyl-beta-L-altrosamine transaminase [Hydrogenovibrio halophilus]